VQNFAGGFMSFFTKKLTSYLRIKPITMNLVVLVLHFSGNFVSTFLPFIKL